MLNIVLNTFSFILHKYREIYEYINLLDRNVKKSFFFIYVSVEYAVFNGIFAMLKISPKFCQHDYIYEIKVYRKFGFFND